MVRKHLKEKEFKQIKALLEVGLSKMKVGEVVKRGYGLIYKVASCKTFAEYDNKFHGAFKASLKTRSASVPPSGVKDQLDRIETLLKELADRRGLVL